MPVVIISKSKGSFYGRRNSKRMRSEDESRYWLRGGMAKVALRSKRESVQVDCRGTPLFYANRMSDGTSEEELEKWSKGRRRSYSYGKGKEI